MDKKQYDEGIRYYQKALMLNPSLADAYNNIGNALREKGLLDEAITYYRKAIALDPSLADAYNNIGNALREKGLLDEAITYYRKAIALNPSLADAYNNLGNALQEKGLVDEAITYCRKAIALDPSLADAYNNLGNALQEKGLFDEAMIDYRKAIELNPDSETAHFNLAMGLLLSGHYSMGWKKYEWRWKTREFLRKSCLHRPDEFSQPIWDGTSLEGKSLLVYAEQGVGDEIMFASCFQEAIEQAGACTVECDKRLIPIFSRSFPGAEFIRHAEKDDVHGYQLPKSDAVIPMGSLPKFLRADIDAFPRRSYLVPDADKVEFWSNRFKAIGEGMKIGISWRGGRIPRVIRKRSLALTQWAGLFSLSGVHFINLQYGDSRQELREAKEQMHLAIHDWEDADPLKDLDNFAAQIASLDLVISVDNSTVHMAGALGKPVWVLLSYVPVGDRWSRGTTVPPYPQVKLFRQTFPGDWKSVISKLSEELRKR